MADVEKRLEAMALCEYPVVHSVNTHTLKYGELTRHAEGKQRMVLVIAGNPGAIEFYDEFMRELHRLSGWPVWGLSHAGHSVVPQHVDWNEPDESVFTLEGQIQHKVCFINEHIPDDTEIVLIGHSVGAYVVLEIMNRVESHKILEGFLLFPTIERMAESPQGRRMTPILKYWRWLLVLMSAGLYVLPHEWKKNMIDYVLDKRARFRSAVPQCIRGAALNLFSPYCVSKTTYMAHIEMEKVTDLDRKTVERHINKLRFYYGATDHWCPTHYYDNIKALFPDHKHLYLCDRGFRHAFIIDASKPMASVIDGWLKSL